MHALLCRWDVQAAALLVLIGGAGALLAVVAGRQLRSPL